MNLLSDEKKIKKKKVGILLHVDCELASSAVFLIGCSIVQSNGRIGKLTTFLKCAVNPEVKVKVYNTDSIQDMA